MIGSDSEYRRSLEILEEGRRWHAEEKRCLEKAGHTPEEIRRLLEPSVCFCLQIAEEVKHYEV